MQNLIYLIIMALAGGAGWYGGSWKGRDAIAALDQAKAVGVRAVAERDKLQVDLQKELTRLTGEFEQGQQQRDSEHVKQATALRTALAGSDKTVADLRRLQSGKQTEIARLAAQATDQTTAPAERLRLQAEVARLQREVQDRETLIAGFECSKVAVPAELLSPLQGS